MVLLSALTAFPQGRHSVVPTAPPLLFTPSLPLSQPQLPPPFVTHPVAHAPSTRPPTSTTMPMVVVAPRPSQPTWTSPAPRPMAPPTTQVTPLTTTTASPAAWQRHAVTTTASPLVSPVRGLSGPPATTFASPLPGGSLLKRRRALAMSSTLPQATTTIDSMDCAATHRVGQSPVLRVAQSPVVIPRFATESRRRERFNVCHLLAHA